MSKRDKITADFSVDELNAKLVELREQFFKLKLQHTTGQLEKTATLKMVRRDIARAHTFISQKAQG